MTGYLPHFNWWVFRISEPHTPYHPFNGTWKNPLTPPGTGGNWDDMTNAAGDGSWDAPAGDDWSAPAAQPILGMAGKMFFLRGSWTASLPLKNGGWKTIRSYWVLITFQGRTVKLWEGSSFVSTWRIIQGLVSGEKPWLVFPDGYWAGVSYQMLQMGLEYVPYIYGQCRG